MNTDAWDILGHLMVILDIPRGWKPRVFCGLDAADVYLSAGLYCNFIVIDNMYRFISKKVKTQKVCSLAVEHCIYVTIRAIPTYRVY